MYELNGKEKLREAIEIPPSEGGAPMPSIVSNEGDVVIAYIVGDSPIEVQEGWISLDENLGDGFIDYMAIVKFKSFECFYFGHPNDEALSGHPLYKIGLSAYSNFEVLNSPWIQIMEKRNSVHPYHSKNLYEKLRHFIMVFHDRTFECLADDFEVYYGKGNWANLVQIKQRILGVEG